MTFSGSPALARQHAGAAVVALLADAQAVDGEIDQVAQAVADVAAAVLDALDPAVEVEPCPLPSLT